MKQKELTKTFMMISNCKKNPLVYMVYTIIFKRCKGRYPLFAFFTTWLILNNRPYILNNILSKYILVTFIVLDSQHKSDIRVLSVNMVKKMALRIKVKQLNQP